MTTAEAETLVTPSAAADDHSSDDPTGLGIQQDTEPQVEESDKPAQDAEPKDAASLPDKGTDAYYDALQSKVDAGEPLTTEQKTELSSHHQSLADRARARVQEREARAKDEARVSELASGLPARLTELVNLEVEAAQSEGRAISQTLLQNAFSGEVGKITRELSAVVLAPVAVQIKAKLLESVGGPNTSAGRAMAAELQGASFYEVYGAAVEHAYNMGQANTPAAKKATDLQKQVDDLKAENSTLAAKIQAQGSGPVADGKEVPGASVPYSKMTPPQRAAMTPEQRDAAVAREAASRR